MNINIQIERLILHEIDLPSNQRHLLKAAVEAELTRLIATEGLKSGSQSSRVVPSLLIDAITYSSGSNPTEMAQQIAWSVYQKII